MSVTVSVLYFDGCPHWQAMIERVRAAAAQIDVAVQVETVAVETDEQAHQLGFTGSPTVLLGGRDPFATPSAPAALACRVYATPAGPAWAPR